MPRLTPPLPSPKMLAAPLKLMPDSLIATPLTLSVNHIFRQPVEEGEFDFLEDKWVRIHVTDSDLEFYLGFDGEQLIIGRARPSDVTFKGDTSAFATLALRREDPDTLFFQRRLMIEGDTELGLGLKNLLASLDLEQMPPMLRRAMTLGNKLQGLAIAN